MQNADIYTELNKSTAKYTDMLQFLQDHQHMLQWRPEEVILDAGCGPGDVTATVLQQWLPSDFRYLLGVDVSTKMIKHAQAVNTEGKVEFSALDVGGDVLQLLTNEKYSEGFDKVFSFYVLHWLHDIERGIKNIHTLLKPGGQALLTFPVDRHFQMTYQQIRTKNQWTKYFKGVERPLCEFPRTADPAQEFRQMLESAGFHVIKAQAQDSISSFADMDVVKGLLSAYDAIHHSPRDILQGVGIKSAHPSNMERTFLILYIKEQSMERAMQNVEIYIDNNNKCNRYKDLLKFLGEYEQLFEWRPEEVILDAGCGPGDVTAEVLQQWLPSDFQHLLGVDVSARMIEHAWKHYQQEKVSFLVNDIGTNIAEILEFKRFTQGFDKVFSFCALHWLPDLQRGLSNIYALLKPGGQALLTFPVDRPFQKAHMQVQKNHQWKEYFKCAAQRPASFPKTTLPSLELRDILDSLGFLVLTCETQDLSTAYESIQDIKGLTESLEPNIECLPCHLKFLYLDNCLQTLEDMDALCRQTCTIRQLMITCVIQKPEHNTT